MAETTRPTDRLPTDSHVHSQWSWDAPGGSMERTCEQALRLGLPALLTLLPGAPSRADPPSRSRPPAPAAAV